MVNGKTVSLILFVLYTLSIPWFMPQMQYTFFNLPLWIWFYLLMNVLIALTVTCYLLYKLRHKGV
jgi:hypothetical protein